MDNPKLSTMRSRVSMPRSVFRAGNNAKTRTYPGMNRMNGSPRMRRRVGSMLKRTRGTRRRLASRQMIMSSGYVSKLLFMVSG